MICNVRCDTALYDLPAPRTGEQLQTLYMYNKSGRYQIGEKVRMNLIIINLEHFIESMKNNKPIKEALKAYAHRQGYQ